MTSMGAGPTSPQVAVGKAPPNGAACALAPGRAPGGAWPPPVVVEGELGSAGCGGAGCWRLGIASACKSRLFC